ncbi:MAG: [protein-PII] uridylyltransferase, partial [Pseudomonadota bacterium]
MNKHPQPSPPLASKAASENDAESAPLQTAGNAGALAVFDPASTRAAITARFRKEDGAVQQRAMIVEVLGKALEKGRAALAESLSEAPVVSRPITRGYAALHDGIVDTVYWAATTLFHPNSVHTQGERLAVLAVGGYGRFEMAPHSDIDLLFLTPHKITPWVESIVETMLYVLWDLKLKVGQASRTLRDCIRLAREDFTIRTSMVEQRVICGDSALAQELKEKLWSELFKNTAPEFIEAKLNERAQRHRKQGGQRYVVEPNVKEGKGGLRDLQSLFWIAKYMHGVNDAKELVALGMFSEDEFETFVTAEDFLWAVRCHLHLIADRAVDQLSFDMQVAVAERMGYADGKGRRAVEHFMQDYFLQATRVGELTRIFLTGLEETHVKSEPVLQRFFKRQPKVRAPFAILQNRITVQSEDAFLDDKLNILRLFEEALRTGSLIHPDAMRIVSANLHLIDDDMRERKEAVRIFHDLLLKHGNPERSLRRMNELGVLAAFLPEFEPIVAMMQFNMYHHYTV